MAVRIMRILEDRDTARLLRFVGDSWWGPRRVSLPRGLTRIGIPSPSVLLRKLFKKAGYWDPHTSQGVQGSPVHGVGQAYPAAALSFTTEPRPGHQTNICAHYVTSRCTPVLARAPTGQSRSPGCLSS